MSRINERLREARINAGFSQKRLAELSNLTKVGYQNYEYGRSEPKTQAALRIAKILGTTVEALWGEAPASAQMH